MKSSLILGSLNRHVTDNFPISPVNTCCSLKSRLKLFRFRQKHKDNNIERAVSILLNTQLCAVKITPRFQTEPSHALHIFWTIYATSVVQG